MLKGEKVKYCQTERKQFVCGFFFSVTPTESFLQVLSNVYFFNQSLK